MKTTLRGITVLALLLIPCGSATADVRIGARVGDSFVVFDPDGVRGQIVLGRHKHKPRHSRPRHRARPVVIIRERRQERDPVPEPDDQPDVADPTRPGPPVSPPDPEPVAPADPAGHARIARAPSAARVPLAVGDRLAPGTPHVMLDPLRFDLPAAPEGQIYVRVRKQVLRITRTGRRITQVLAP